MATSGCNDTHAEKTEVESLQVLRPSGSRGGGTEGLPYLYHRPMQKGLAKADDDYVTEAFKQLPMPDQEKLIEELSNQLHQDVLVEKLFDENSKTYKSRCFAGLPLKLPFTSYNRFENNYNHCYPCNTIGTLVSGTIVSGICEGFGQQIVQQIFEGIVGGSEESSRTLEFFKVKTLDLRGSNEVGTGTTSATTQ
ncbi:hypothetical protein D5086_009296 [Populus alba]|uniref:Uncharacterized protein n=2 Tax=Populus alba TaxID=43335 RepID=A0A4U5NMD7_POPAL|nr:hypothetical protein D5086_0000253980 [Populus alba]